MPFASSKKNSASRPHGDFIELGEIVQPSRKIVAAFAVEGDFDPAALRSNRFELEWPPKSGRMQSFPEIDRVDVVRAQSGQGQNSAGTTRLYRPAVGCVTQA